MNAAVNGDAARLDAWWQEVLATGALPAAAVTVQGRLVRQVGRAELPSGPVYLKVMAFPRRRDRWRYLLRALPAAHEAAMLARVGSAGVPCPEVVAARTARRGGWPFRSMLVLRALPVAPGTGAEPPADPPIDPAVELRDRAAVAARLAGAGLVHRDLKPDNFARLAGGRLAVLDLQSMRCTRRPARAGRTMATRLLLDAALVPVHDALAILAAAGLIDRHDVGCEQAARAQLLAFVRSRVLRCLTTSTEFERRDGLLHVDHRRRVDGECGRAQRGGRELLRCWIGQRVLQLFAGAPPVLLGLRRPRALVPLPSTAVVDAGLLPAEAEQRLAACAQAYSQWRRTWRPASAPGLDELRRIVAGLGGPPAGTP